MAVVPETENKLILMALRGELTHDARQNRFEKGALKKLASVFNKYGVNPKTVIDQDDLPRANEFYVSVDADKCEDLARDIKNTKAVTRLEVL